MDIIVRHNMMHLYIFSFRFLFPQKLKHHIQIVSRYLGTIITDSSSFKQRFPQVNNVPSRYQITKFQIPSFQGRPS